MTSAPGAAGRWTIARSRSGGGVGSSSVKGAMSNPRTNHLPPRDVNSKEETVASERSTEIVHRWSRVT
jgi:hypothetical protein